MSRLPRRRLPPTMQCQPDRFLMEELLKTNDIVLISFVEALLTEAAIEHIVLDQNMSIVEGSIGVIPRRILVERDAMPRALILMKEAGLDHELSKPT